MASSILYFRLISPALAVAAVALAIATNGPAKAMGDGLETQRTQEQTLQQVKDRQRQAKEGQQGSTLGLELTAAAPAVADGYPYTCKTAANSAKCRFAHDLAGGYPAGPSGGGGGAR